MDFFDILKFFPKHLISLMLFFSVCFHHKRLILMNEVTNRSLQYPLSISAKKNLKMLTTKLNDNVDKILKAGLAWFKPIGLNHSFKPLV